MKVSDNEFKSFDIARKGKLHTGFFVALLRQFII